MLPRDGVLPALSPLRVPQHEPVGPNRKRPFSRRKRGRRQGNKLALRARPSERLVPPGLEEGRHPRRKRSRGLRIPRQERRDGGQRPLHHSGGWQRTLLRRFSPRRQRRQAVGRRNAGLPAEVIHGLTTNAGVDAVVLVWRPALHAPLDDRVLTTIESFRVFEEVCPCGLLPLHSLRLHS